MTPDRLGDFIAHMIDAAVRVREFARPLTRDAFLADRKSQDAIVYNLLIIGEAASRIVTEYPEFTAAHDDIPWSMLRGMRNRMAHGYFKLDMAVVWTTVQTSVPELHARLIEALRAHRESS